jgi:hypothetical protein
MQLSLNYRRGRGRVHVPIIVAALTAIAAIAVLPQVYDTGAMATADDPAIIADHLLARAFTGEVADREIRAALAGNDIDLANSFAELARERGVAIDRDLTEQLVVANSTQATARRHVGNFTRGLITGEPDDAVGLAGTAVGDLFVIGDVRDAAREGYRLAKGEAADELVLGLAAMGIAVTAGTYASLGAGTPARVGLSLAKVARRTGVMSRQLAGTIGRSFREVVDAGALRRALTTVSLSEPALAVRVARDAVKLDKAGELVKVAGDVGRIEGRAGVRAAFDGMRLAENPREVARVAKLAEKKGLKTRAILKLLGRAVLAIGVLTFEGASWLLTAVLLALGFCSSVKGMAERATLRAIRRGKQRRARREREAATGPRLATAACDV